MRLLLLCFFICLGACQKKEGHSEKAEKFHFDEVAEDIKIPLKVWDWTWPLAENFIFSDFKVILVEKNPGVLVSPRVEVSYPRGGGQIDLADYLSGRPGTFFFKVEFSEFVDANEKRVFFVSRHHQLQVGDEIIGSGCNKLLNITKQALKSMDGEGLKLNTTDGRHIAVAGGTFIFASQKESQNFITQLTVRDRNHSDLICTGN